MDTNGYAYQNQGKTNTSRDSTQETRTKSTVSARDFAPSLMSDRLLKIARAFKLISYIVAGLYVLVGIIELVLKVSIYNDGAAKVATAIGLLANLVRAGVTLLLGQLIVSLLAVLADRQEKTDVMLRLVVTDYKKAADEAELALVEQGLAALEQASAARLQQVQLVFQFTPGGKPVTAYGYGAGNIPQAASSYGAMGYQQFDQSAAVGYGQQTYGQNYAPGQTAYPTYGQNYTPGQTVYPVYGQHYSQGQQNGYTPEQGAYGWQQTYDYGQQIYNQQADRGGAAPHDFSWVDYDRQTNDVQADQPSQAWSADPEQADASVSAAVADFGEQASNSAAATDVETGEKTLE